MNKNCVQCGAGFEVTDADLEFLKKIAPVVNGKKFEVPMPELCTSCCIQGLMTFRNQSSLYRRKCDKTGKEILSMYRADAPFPVYNHDEWLKQDWDARAYGRDYDFNKPFFQQFLSLRNAVPHMALVFQANINCDYCNLVGHSKNCYLIYGSVECEDCYYGNPFRCKQCVDSFILRNSELCLECVDSNNLYNCYRCQNCANSSDLMFCFEVNNSQNCFCCAAVSRKNYCIFNRQYSKEEYEKILSGIDLTDDVQFKEIMNRFDELKRAVCHRCYVGVNNENVIGDYVFNSKDCVEVYGGENCRDVAAGFQLMNVNDAMNVINGEYCELVYQVSAFYDRVTNVIFSYFCWLNVHNSIYCAHCTQNVNNCFGCIALKNAEYCILNKEYTKEEYEKLVPQIIEHMRRTGEWGRFFPMSISPFAYNETVASEFFPMSKDEVLAKGWNWADDSVKSGVVDKDVLVCEVSGKPFKIIPQERKMYDRFKVVLPKRSPKQRHLDRIALRNPMKLNDVACFKCGVRLKSTYSQERSEKVYCEECYLKEVY